MNVLDLFSGIGGFSLGLERAGMRTVAFCEIDPFCRRVLAKHWPTIPVYDDVRTLTAARLSDSESIRCQRSLNGSGAQGNERNPPIEGTGVDIICGGFPCQDISVAGKGAGIGGERSGLWSEYARIIGEVRPRYVIVENVAALLGRGLSRVLGDLAALGFDAEWHCIPASAVGAPHRRDRVWIVAYSSATERGAFNSPLRRYTRDDGLSQRQEGSGRFEPSCEAVADATIDGSSIGGGWWSAEPDVGRVVDGLSLELDFSRQITAWCNASKGNYTKAKPTRNELVRCLLRAMWEHREVAASSPELYVRKLQGSVPNVPLQDAHSRWLLGARIEKDEGLRDLWKEFYAEPLEKAQDLQFKLLERAWSAKRSQTVGARTDRLRSLGNAVVPQIPEIIGRAIMKAQT